MYKLNTKICVEILYSKTLNKLLQPWQSIQERNSSWSHSSLQQSFEPDSLYFRMIGPTVITRACECITMTGPTVITVIIQTRQILFRQDRSYSRYASHSNQKYFISIQAVLQSLQQSFKFYFKVIQSLQQSFKPGRFYFDRTGLIVITPVIQTGQILLRYDRSYSHYSSHSNRIDFTNEQNEDR